MDEDSLKPIGPMFKKITDELSEIKGSKGETYFVRTVNGETVCSCPAFKFGKGKDCKHISKFKLENEMETEKTTGMTPNEFNDACLIVMKDDDKSFSGIKYFEIMRECLIKNGFGQGVKIMDERLKK